MDFLENNLKEEIHYYLKKLFPLCRSITGNNNRTTLEEISKLINLNKVEINSGLKVFDWVVPDEWNINDAFISDENGNKIVDFKKCNLHVVSYSMSINKFFSFEKLKKNLHMHEKFDNAIPYRTTYYERNWGFCVTKKQYNELSKATGPLKVFIDSNFSKGSLTYGEYLLEGSSDKEILISCYMCHPSMANDSLSGLILTSFLARYLSQKKYRKWNYRFLFIPETIGAITYCSLNKEKMEKIKEGLVITTVGGKGKFGYKKYFSKKSNKIYSGLVTSLRNMIREELDLLKTNC